MSAIVNASPLARQLKTIWRRLPDGPMGERELEERILEVTNHGEGDFAWAGAVRASLVSACALIVRPGDEPRTYVYERTQAFPEWPLNNGPGSDAYNASLRRLAEVHEAEMRENDRALAEALESSPAAIQRRQMIALIDERIDKRIGELLTAMDDSTLARMRARFTDQAGVGQPEGDAHDELS